MADVKATGADAGASALLWHSHKAKVQGFRHQRRMTWILPASDCRDTGESRIVR